MLGVQWRAEAGEYTTAHPENGAVPRQWPPRLPPGGARAPGKGTASKQRPLVPRNGEARGWKDWAAAVQPGGIWGSDVMCEQMGQDRAAIRL